MIKGLYQYWADLRYIIRWPPSYVFLLIYLAVIITVDMVNHSLSPVHGLFIIRSFVVPFSTCLAVFLSIHLYLMDKNHYLIATPLSIVWPLIGKWLSIMTYLSVYTLATIAVFLWNAYSWGIQETVLRMTLARIGLSMELTYGFAVSMGLLIAAILRNRFAYLISFSIFLVGTFLFPFIMTEKQFLVPFKAPPILHMTGSTEPVWGMILSQQEVTSLWQLMAVLMVVFFVGAMAAEVLRRPTKNIFPTLFTLFVALAFAGISLFAHYRFWSNQFSDIKEHHSVSTPVANADNRSRPPFKVTDYQIDLFKDGNMWTLNSRLNVDISEFPSQGKFSFTINPDFQVEQVTINGRIVDYSQRLGWIDLPIYDFDHLSTHQTISFIYTGRLDEWGIGDNGGETWYAFTDGATFYLPAYLAWYPLPGRVPLYFQVSKNVYKENLGSPLTNTPVNYTVRLHDLDQPVFSTSLDKETLENDLQEITGTNQTGMTLFGGQFKTWESKNVTAVLPAYYDHVRPALTSDIGSLRDFLQDTFKKPIRGKLVFLPISEKLFIGQHKTGNALILPCHELDRLSDHIVDGQMEDQMIDYFLTGGKLLQDHLGDENSLNKTYIHAISHLYHQDQDNDKSGENLGPLVQQVISEIDNDHEILLKSFLRTLMENQKDPDHPVITKDAWNLAWDTTFKNGA